MNTQSLARVFGTGIVTLLIASTAAFAGGANGGGGNPSPVSIANSCDVYDSISDAQMALPKLVLTYLNTAQANPDGGPYGQFGATQLFIKDIANTKKRLNSIHWQIRDNKLCYYIDAQGHRVYQIGAGNPATNTICLSAAGLLKDKIPVHIIQRKVLALAFREFSHLLGSSENQAAQFQQIAEAYLNTYSFEDLGVYAYDYSRALDRYHQDTGNYIKLINKVSDSKLSDAECMAVTFLLSDARGINEASSQESEVGLDLLSTNALNKLDAAVDMTSNLLKYSCPLISTYKPTPRSQVIKQLKGLYQTLGTVEFDLYPIPPELVSSSCTLNVSNSK